MTQKTKLDWRDVWAVYEEMQRRMDSRGIKVGASSTEEILEAVLAIHREMASEQVADHFPAPPTISISEG